MIESTTIVTPAIKRTDVTLVALTFHHVEKRFIDLDLLEQLVAYCTAMFTQVQWCYHYGETRTCIFVGLQSSGECDDRDRMDRVASIMAARVTTKVLQWYVIRNSWANLRAFYVSGTSRNFQEDPISFFDTLDSNPPIRVHHRERIRTPVRDPSKCARTAFVPQFQSVSPSPYDLLADQAPVVGRLGQAVVVQVSIRDTQGCVDTRMALIGAGEHLLNTYHRAIGVVEWAVVRDTELVFASILQDDADTDTLTSTAGSIIAAAYHRTWLTLPGKAQPGRFAFGLGTVTMPHGAAEFTDLEFGARIVSVVAVGTTSLDIAPYYLVPSDSFHAILRLDPNTESGYSVSVEHVYDEPTLLPTPEGRSSL